MPQKVLQNRSASHTKAVAYKGYHTADHLLPSVLYQSLMLLNEVANRRGEPEGAGTGT
jgi:hypothetical protein